MLDQKVKVLESLKRCHGNIGALKNLFFRYGKQKEGEENPFTEIIFKEIKAAFEVLPPKQKSSMRINFKHYASDPGYKILASLDEEDVVVNRKNVILESVLAEVPVVPFDKEYKTLSAELAFRVATGA